MIPQERIRCLKDLPPQEGKYVLYWMQASQRAEWNHALEYALLCANERRKPFLVFFGLTDRFPEANLRHYRFMLEGLQETQRTLKKRGIKMVVRHGSPEKGVLEVAQDAVLCVTDRGYLRIQRQWRTYVAERIPCPFFEVESEVIVPVERASSHEEYGAYTLRPKIKRLLPLFLKSIEEKKVHRPSLFLPPFPGELDLSSLDELLTQLDLDRSVSPVNLRGGTERAKEQLAEFVTEKLPLYHTKRNDPSENYLSGMSPYLHFGQISPLYIAFEIQRAECPDLAKESYLEELIVRRELAMNFVFYHPHYDSFLALPSWAQETLLTHAQDRRTYLYHLEELEKAKTHDSLWNAAQKEMVLTGKMHGYLRMYWGKKILEWSKDPEEAFRIALYLNNKYSLDGRDPNSFAGVAWCFGKHDRAFPERPIFGKVRYMGKEGLQRKFPLSSYIERVARLSHDFP